MGWRQKNGNVEISLIMFCIEYHFAFIFCTFCRVHDSDPYRMHPHTHLHKVHGTLTGLREGFSSYRSWSLPPPKIQQEDVSSGMKAEMADSSWLGPQLIDHLPAVVVVTYLVKMSEVEARDSTPPPQSLTYESNCSSLSLG